MLSKVSKEEIIEKMQEEMELGIAHVRPILETDLFKFNKFVMQVEEGRDSVPLAPVHKEMCEFIDKNKRKKKKRKFYSTLDFTLD